MRGLARRQLPRRGAVPAASTADAVREVAGEATGTRAAIGPRLAARRYGAVMLAEDLEDDPGNATRFVWLAPRRRRAAAARRGPAKTSLVFWGAGAGAPGWLVRCLAEFAFAGVNLTRIESRPLRRGLGDYMFFLDLEGSMADPAVAGARRRTCAGTPRWFESSARSRAPKNGPAAAATLRDDGQRRTPRPTGVRAARRPPAART